MNTHRIPVRFWQLRSMKYRSIFSFILFNALIWRMDLLAQESPSDALNSDSIRFGKITVNDYRDLTFVSTRTFIKYFDWPVNQQSFLAIGGEVADDAIKQGFPVPLIKILVIAPVTDAGYTYLNPTLLCDWGDLVKIDTIFCTGLQKTRPAVIQKSLTRFLHSPYRPLVGQSMVGALSKFASVKNMSEPELVRTREGRYGVLFHLTEINTNEFSGVLGYIPAKGGLDGYFTGEINLALRNIAGSGREAAVYWSKPNRNSQQIRLHYFEPWLLGSNYAGQVDFSQILRDTLVVIRDLTIEGKREMGIFSTIRLRLARQVTIPTPGGRTLLGLENSRNYRIGGGFDFDNRDYPANPSCGVSVRLTQLCGRMQSTTGDKTWLYESTVTAEIYSALRTKTILAQKFNFNGRWMQNGRLSYADNFWLGGATSLRGYPNDFFRGFRVGWLTHEIRYVFGKDSRVYLFYDQGFCDQLSRTNWSKFQTPYSYGIGTRLTARIGIIGIDYGFGQKDTFSTAKIHLTLENRF